MLLPAFTVITYTINFALAFIVISKNRKSYSHFLLALFAILIAFWAGANYFSLSTLDLQNRLFWVRMVMAITAPVPTVLYLLAKSFPSNRLGVGKKQLIILSLAAIFVGILSFTPYMFSNYIWKSDAPTLIPGPAVVIYGVHLVFLIGSAIYTLNHKMLNSEGLVKLQINFFLLGLFLTAVLAVVTNFVLVVMLNSLVAVALGPMFSIVMISFIAYSIVKHRFLDIRLVIARTISYTLLTLILVGLYASSLFLVGNLLLPTNIEENQIVISVILALVVAYTFQPLRRYLEDLTEDVFYKDNYDSEDLLKDLSLTLSTTIDIKELGKGVIAKILDTLHVDTGDIFLLVNNQLEKYNHRGFVDNAKQYDPKKLDCLFMDNMHIYIFDELEEGECKNMLREQDIGAAVKLTTKDKVIGVLILGNKKSGEVYTTRDVQVLEILGPQMAIALQNAQRYEEIRQFSKKLEAEVESATSDLKQANQKLKLMDKQKDEFISVVAHELRSPVTAIKGFVSLILDGDTGEIPKEAREYLNETFNATERMVRLVTNMLNVSRIEEGRLVYQVDKVNLSEVAFSVYKEQSIEAQNKGLEFVIDIQNGVKDQVVVDPDRLHEVVLNLVGNAVKFTDKGFVKIKVSQPIDGVVRLEVIDSGPGVTPEEQQKLFGKFVRAESSAGKTIGSGLGLYISKLLIEKFGGRIGLVSESGKGSNFWFDLPVSE